VQVDPAALELQLIDLALAVVFAAGLEGQDLQVAGQMLELSQQVSYRHPIAPMSSAAARLRLRGLLAAEEATRGSVRIREAGSGASRGVIG
jgi:hypothetical protein